jgi:hypothetical protein
MAMPVLLRILTTPSCWMRNRRFDARVDVVLNKLLDEYAVTKLTAHHMVIGGRVVWVANWPYCFGHFTDRSDAMGLPSRATCFRLRDRLMEEELKFSVTQ